MKRTKLFTDVNKTDVPRSLNKFLQDHEPNVELVAATYHQFPDSPAPYGIFAIFETSTSYAHKGDSEGLWN